VQVVQAAAVCGSAHGSVRTLRAAVFLVVYGSAHMAVCGSVRQCAAVCGSVRQCATVCDSVVQQCVCGNAAVCGSAALCGSSALYIYIMAV
jgi:hypothetical protein